MTDLFDKYGHPIKVLINPDCPSDLFDKSGRPHIVVENADGIDLSTGEFLAALLKGGNLLHIPTHAGWSSTVVGSGTVTEGLSRQAVQTGTTANSSARLHVLLYGFRIGSTFYKHDWDKKQYLIFNYCRSTGDSEAVARFQLKEVETEGALAAKGLGIRLDNYALKGESYGTSLGVIDLGVTLVSLEGIKIAILHYPASKIEWYVNGVLKGTQTTTANIPSGLSTATPFMVQSIINGATGGFDVTSHLIHPKIWQEA